MYQHLTAIDNETEPKRHLASLNTLASIFNINITTIMRATLNIGLNNNPFTQDQILEKLSDDYTIINSRFAVGSYEGDIEPTLVVAIDSPYAHASGFIKKIEQLADVLTQNCIAVSTDQFDLLCYAQGYKGEKFKFDSQYFIG